MMLTIADHARIAPAVLCLAAALGAAGQARAQAPGDPCRARGSLYTVDTQAQYTESDVAGVASSVRSAAMSVRRCLSNTGSLTAGVYFDDIDIAKYQSTAARLLVGYLGRREGHDIGTASTYWVYGVNATAGYEDFHFASGSPPIFRKDQRLSTSLEALGGFAIVPVVDRLTHTTGLEHIYVEGRVAVFDKHAPSADAPTYANETYEAATATLVLTQFVDHAPHGSKIDYLFSQQHLFSDTLLVSDISTVRVQWRLQRDELLAHAPDRLIVGVQASFGDNDYRSWSLTMGTSF